MAVSNDYKKLEALGLQDITTSTPWTEGKTTFSGVSAAELMRQAGATGQTVVAVALNDYSERIPLSDFEQHRVLLAIKLDGKRMRVRDKGPIWIIYPDAAADHDRQDIRARMVWQLKELRVE